MKSNILAIALRTKSFRAFAKAEEMLGEVDRETQKKLDIKYNRLVGNVGKIKTFK